MESQLSHPHNKPKACYKTESRSKNQHQETTVPPGMRGVQNEKGVKSVDSLMQTKSPTGTLAPSTPTTSAPTSPTASPATSTSLLVPAATPSSIISIMTPTTKIMDERALGITQGTTLTGGTSEHKIKYSREEEQRTTEKNSSKNLQKLTPQISASTDLQKSFQKTPPTKTGLPKSVQQTTFSQISMSSQKLRSSPIPASDDRAETICKGRTKEMAPSLAPKLKSNHSGAFVMEDSQEVHSVQPLDTKQRKIEKLQMNKDEEKNRSRAEEEGTSKDVQGECSLKGKEITPQVLSQSPIFPLDRLQSLSGSPTASASQVKKTAGKTEENATAQEKMCESGKRREWMDSMERREALKHKNGQKVKNQEKTDEEMEKKMKRQGKNIEANEQKDIEMENSKPQKNFNHIFKSFKDVTTMTNYNPISVQTFDAALQTELVYKDAEVQAVVDVRDKSTTTSPNMTRSSWSQLANKANFNNHEKVSETASLKLQNGLSQDVSVDSGLAPVELMDQSPKATPYNSSISSKPTRQHVCQIEIELCSQSTLSDSLVLPKEEGSQFSSTRPGLEREPKQVDKDQAQAEKGLLREVAWDDQGMTWEIYGAAVDMESLGFAIQNHLQRKITEHEQRIRHLRKSVSLSENSEGKEARKKKKKKVFRSLRPTCCLKSESEASIAY